MESKIQDLPSQMSTIDVMGILPHRYPFLLVDRVLEIERPNKQTRVGHKLTAVKAVTANEAFFQGHFPEQPIMPGVLIIETIAQAAGLLAYRPHPTKGKWKFYIIGVDNTRFRKPIFPGHLLTLKVEMTKDRGHILAFVGKAYVENELAAETEILAQMGP